MDNEKNCEKAAEKDINWYKAQAEELKAIRKDFYEICGDTANGNDAYFPDLVAAELRKVKKEVI